MAATCTTCDTAAGPTIRVEATTIHGGTVSFSMTFQQALDLREQIDRQFAENNVPHHLIPE